MNKNTNAVNIGMYFGYPVYIFVPLDMDARELEDIIASFKETMAKGFKTPSQEKIKLPYQINKFFDEGIRS